MWIARVISKKKYLLKQAKFKSSVTVNLTVSPVISPQNVKTVWYSSFLPMSHLRQCCAVAWSYTGLWHMREKGKIKWIWKLHTDISSSRIQESNSIALHLPWIRTELYIWLGAWRVIIMFSEPATGPKSNFIPSINSHSTSHNPFLHYQPTSPLQATCPVYLIILD